MKNKVELQPDLNCKTLIEVFNSIKRIENKGLTFINSSDSEEYISYRDFYKEVLGFQSILRHDFHLSKNDELILSVNDNHSFLKCFWACVIGGIIPIPVSVGGKHEHKKKVFKLLQKHKNAQIFTSIKNLDRLYSFGNENGLKKIANSLTNRFIDAHCDFEQNVTFSKAKISPQDIGFIQYSSGSTGNPKGIVLTHENLTYNIHDIVERIGLDQYDNALNWIPLTHDLGMIGFHLSCMLTKCNQYVMSTQLFIRRPLLWMEKAHQFQASRLYSPNFGYQYFLQAFNRFREGKQWDLSSVKSIFNGAEPISAGLCRDFVESLGSFGMPENSITPCYGLAEASVGVTCCNVKDPLQEYFIERESLVIGGRAKFSKTYSKNKTVSFVGAGKTFSNCYIRILGTDGQELANGLVGHIQVQGKNVTKAYFNEPEKTKETMTSDGWLKTGDLGLLLEDNSLIITGRHKNMIILQGQNYYAHDIESLLHNVEGISLGRVVACGVSGDSRQKETLLVFILFKKPSSKFIPLIREVEEKLSSFLDIVPDHVIPVREIPKTTSGKIQHNVLLSRYQRGDFNQIISEIQKVTLQMFRDEWKHLQGNERQLAIKQWLLKQCLLIAGSGSKTISTEKPLADQGFKSVHAVQLSRALKNQLALSTNDTLLYRYPSVSQLSIWINDRLFPVSIVDDTMRTQTVVSSDEKILDELEALSDDEVVDLLLNDEVY